MSLIEAKNLSKCYNIKAKDQIFAVNNISLSIEKGEIVGLVGESGCGKSTLGKLLLKLENTTQGNVIFKGEDITEYSFDKMRPIRRNMQMIFQNSLNAFNPYFTVSQVIREPLNNFSQANSDDKENLVIDMLEKVGLGKKYLSRYGSELSGGQRQRVGIARALILNPEFVVCDEPTSSVDYAIRNQILELLVELKNKIGLTYLFISHDISAVNRICSRVVVMYLGNIVEIIPCMNRHIVHPYTQALMAATLSTDPRKRRERKVLFKENEEHIVPKQGCVFQNRCFYVEDICRNERPELTKTSNEGSHFVACHFCNTKNLKTGGYL